MPYNFATVDGLTALGPVPVNETLATVHPDRDLDALLEQTEATRAVVRTGTWWLIASTQSQ